jgi:hypothetical protein
MKMHETDWDERMQKFLDGELDAADVRALLEAAQRDVVLAAKLNAMKSVHQYLGRSVLESPSAGFTQRMMARLEHLPHTVRHSPRNGLLLLMGVLVACTVLILILGHEALPGGTLRMDTSRLPLPDVNIHLTVNLKWVINGLILVNLALGFLVLDRTVLRPFFERRAGGSVY